MYLPSYGVHVNFVDRELDLFFPRPEIEMLISEKQRELVKTAHL